jgi:branched-chain amino acid transport system substrate-binding protein
MAVVPQAYEDNIPMITASATAAGVTVNQDTGQVFTNMFRTCFIDPFQGEKMADFAMNVLNAQTAAVVFNTDVDYSIGLANAFIAKAETIGLDVVAVEAYMEEAVDFSGQLTNIAVLNPDVLFIPDYHEKISLLTMQARNVGIEATFLGADGWSAVPDAVANLDPVEGSFFISGFSVEDTSPMVQEFLRDYIAAYNEEPIMFAAQAYDAAMILIRAIEAAEASEYATGSDEYRTIIINTIRATDDTFVTGHITFDQYNNPVKTAFIIQIRDGQASFWGTF